MRILYDIIFIIFAILYLPYFLVTGRHKFGMRDRMGILPKRLKEASSKKRVIWIHAVSVGEVKAAGILAPLLRKSFPSHTLVFSTVTHTGNEVAKAIAVGEEAVFYLPVDLSFVVDRVVKTVRPEFFLCLETELWPNLISSLYRFGTKIVLVNGRISNRSFAGYRKIKFVVSRVLRKYSILLMQSEMDAERIAALGADRKKVFVTGNMKFDLALGQPVDKRKEIRSKLNISEDEILFIAGSTHRGEDEQVIGCFLKLKKDYGNIRLLIAPRHIERIKEVERLLLRYNFEAVRYSTLTVNSRLHRQCIFLLDTIGGLNSIYSASDIVFIGGSLVKKGGQNPIEPATFSKPVIIGRFTFNFQDVVRIFLENKACIEVRDKAGLYSSVKDLLYNNIKMKELGLNARQAVERNLGASQRTIDKVLGIM